MGTFGNTVRRFFFLIFNPVSKIALKPGIPECHVFAIFAVQSEVAVLFGNLKFIMHISFMSDHTDS